MGEDTKAHGKRFRPLKKGQISAFAQAAQETNNQLTQLVARTLLHTGLRNGELSHLQQDWIADERIRGKRVLRVPEEAPCIGGVGSVGRGNPHGADLSNRGTACHNCRVERSGHWEPKTINSVRTLPVMEDEIIDLINDWFTHHEQIPLLHRAVSNRVRRVAELADLDRDVKPHDLRHTYGTMLARMGMKAPIITVVMGHGSMRMSRKYVNFVGRDIMEEFQRHWDFDEYS